MSGAQKLCGLCCAPIICTGPQHRGEIKWERAEGIPRPSSASDGVEITEMLISRIVRSILLVRMHRHLVDLISFSRLFFMDFMD